MSSLKSIRDRLRVLLRKSFEVVVLSGLPRGNKKSFDDYF